MNDGAAQDERVRPCLECGTILPFDAEVCSLCGTCVQAGAEEAVKPCLACEALIPESDFFCPQCGDFALRVPVEAGASHVPPLGSQEGRAMTVLSRAVSIAVFLTALLLVGAVAVEAWRVRAFLGG
ncbi:MAG: zinc ribbon domain-containing protein [Planctomycetes bacterium]|nr:zinc ribbon domain-containing protein [Planctomycetota bacterium]